MFLISQINKDGCGKTKSCYSEPANCKGTSDCDFFVTIRPLKGVDCSDDNGEVEFELSTNKDWAAIGFNKEKKMVMRGTNHLYGKIRNSELKIKWFAPLRLRSFAKCGL